MRKLVNAGLSRRIYPFSAALILVLCGLTFTMEAQQGCVMTCPPMDPPVEIPLSSDCEDVLTYGAIGVVLDNCPGEIIVDIIVNGLPVGDSITYDMIGQTFMVIITHPASGQSCMATITVVEQQAPIFDCPEDVTLGCATDLDAYTPLLPEDVSDCSPITIDIDDQLISSSNCSGNIVSQYLRTYTVVDSFGNAASCEQIISLEKADLLDVVFPPSLIGPTALECFPLPDTTPANTGYPTVDGGNILTGSYCNLIAGHSDFLIPLCSGSYKIMRTWIVVDWCNNNQSTSAVQVIEVLDVTPPIVNAPPNITVSTSSTGCTANVILLPAIVTEDCSEVYTVRMQGPFGTINSNGGPLPPLPVGQHDIIFIATTDCIVSGEDTMSVTVEDLSPPTPVCHQFVAIPVNQTGTSLVPATVFNAGSADNCGDVYVKVRRMDTPDGDECFNPGNPGNMFDDFLQLCCEDIPNNNIMVIMRVYDQLPVAGPVPDDYLLGHFNDCMVQVEVQDKLPPQLICPSDLTISCEFPFSDDNLDVFGSVVLAEEDREDICIDDPGAPGGPGLDCIGLDGLATDNCNIELEELSPVIVINNCGVGTITRTFVATDDGGLQTSCQQVISIINYDLFDTSNIVWPQDFTTTDICEINLLDPEDLDPPYNQPTLDDGPCDLVGATYEDAIFEFSNGDQACFKILRTWTVMDWCQLNTPTGGIWSHIQVIKVMNTVAPTIEPIADLDECSFDPECGGLTIDFEATAEDDCSGPASLTWIYFIDEFNDNSFQFSSGEIIGGSVAFTREMPIGTHRIVYTVNDLCGNAATEEQIVTIRSCKAPSAKCIHGLSTNLMAMDTDGDGTPDWGMVTLQAEMFDAGSDHPCGNPVTVAFSADPLDVTRVFDCSDLGVNEIEIWAIDNNGLTDFCITTIEIQDNNGICPPQGGGTGIISGNISVPDAGKLSGAMVYLDGSNQSGIPSGLNGQFVFPAMPLGGEYVVRPVRDGDARNGVTTLDLVKIQKHLLGLELFTNPFQYIAADANNSASITAIDIIQFRKLILGYFDVLPSNQSWRFVDKAFIFPDPLNPWVSTWPETYSIIPFANSMNDVDFNAVKIGDLNKSANLSASGGMILPRGSEKCQVGYTVVDQPEENIYRIEIYAENADDYNALQFSFNWDQNSFKLLDWSAGETISPEDVRLPSTSGDNASIAAFSVNGWENEKTVLLTLWVENIASIKYPFQLYLNQGPTFPVAYKAADEEAVPVQLQLHQKGGNLMENRPNPFSDMTTIRFESFRTEPATLRVTSLEGQIVFTKKVELVPGINEFVVRKSEVKADGIYIYEIESEFQYSTNRMIIVD
ncbi:MAG TPA: T9SS type A sorting domain-containing protein [Saprospiraceae bacterium]